MRTAYITIKLDLDAQTENEVDEIISEMEYSFNHPQVKDTEIIEVEQ